jgi:VWFA-related protein
MTVSKLSKVVRLVLASALATVIPLAAIAQTGSGPGDRPKESALEEEVDVHLVLIDTVVLDRNDRTVPGLTLADFEVIVDRKRIPIDTLDAICPGGAMDDPRGVRSPERRAKLPAPDAGRKIVLALDYLHLTQMERVDVLEQAVKMVRHGLTDKDEVMIAALNGGLRIEQGFTSDVETLTKALERMEFDISLWQPSFAHLTEVSFFGGMQALLNVLGSIPDHKAVVLFSNNPGSTDMHDQEFAHLAASSSIARCSIYPVHTVGLIKHRPG